MACLRSGKHSIGFLIGRSIMYLNRGLYQTPKLSDHQDLPGLRFLVVRIPAPTMSQISKIRLHSFYKNRDVSPMSQIWPPLSLGSSHASPCVSLIIPDLVQHHLVPPRGAFARLDQVFPSRQGCLGIRHSVGCRRSHRKRLSRCPAVA